MDPLLSAAPEHLYCALKVALLVALLQARRLEVVVRCAGPTEAVALLFALVEVTTRRLSG